MNDALLRIAENSLCTGIVNDDSQLFVRGHDTVIRAANQLALKVRATPDLTGCRLNLVLEGGGVLPQLLLDINLVLRAFEGNCQLFVPHRLVDEIRSTKVQGLDGRIDVTMAGDNDHFGFITDMFYFP